MYIFFAILFLKFPLFIPEDANLIFRQTEIQRFEENFQIVNSPQEFLPGWTGNEVRSTASRIFQSAQGRNGSKALAVQPISTFNGILTVSLSTREFEEPKVQFWARSVQNGTGTRAAEVYISWKGSSQTVFSSPVLLGSQMEFPNENQEFSKYQIAIPEGLENQEELQLRFDIRYGSGTGNAARWILDDFEFGDIQTDLSPPRVGFVRGYDEKILELGFSESLDPVFPTFILNYEIEGIPIQKAELKSDSVVYLYSNSPFKEGEKYQLKIRQIPDLNGNFIQDTLVNFTFYDPSLLPSKGIIFNEIMPAPKADLDLPNVEYVEIFNASEKSLRLDELLYSNTRSVVPLGTYWLSPGEFALLVPESQQTLMKAFGKLIPIKNWPSLLNSGDVITLASIDGKTIDQLTYNTSSWKGSDFANGGYSLEIVNPFYSCDQSALIQVSKDPARGTPGRVNSVFNSEPNLQRPILQKSYFKDATQIILEFSSAVFPSLSPSNFSFEPTIQINKIIFEKANSVLIRLESPASPNSVYKLRLLDLEDCYGNALLNEEPFELILPEKAKIGDLIINELLFNPKTGFPKFVELYNTTNSTLEFSGWKLANLDDSGEVAQVKALGEENLQISPNGFVVFTTNSSALMTAFPNSNSNSFISLSSLPSYPIGGGNVVLLNDANQRAEVFKYSEDLHHPLLRDPKGVSLERISASTPVDIVSNWHSASSVAGFATPGAKNSQFISEEFDGNLIQIEPEVFDPEGSSGNTFTSIKYELNQAGWIGNIKIYSISGQLIQVLAQNEILGSRGLFTWTGTDASGGIVRPGYYIVLVELFDLAGNLKKIKKTVVVATRL